MKIIVSVVILFVMNNLSFGQILSDSHNEAVELINQSGTDIKQKKYSEAVKELENAIKLDSTIKKAYVLLNQALFETGEKNIQKKYLKKAKLFFLEDDEFYYYSGKLYMKEEKYDSAIVEFNEAVRFGKINGEDYPIVYDYYASRGICFMKKNLYSDALQDFNYALKLNNSKSSIYSNKGIVLYKLNKVTEACECWKKALEMGENSVKKYTDKYCK